MKFTNKNPVQLPNSARFLPQLDNILRAFEDELNEIHLVNERINNVIARLERSTSIFEKKKEATWANQPIQHQQPLNMLYHHHCV
jgi:hypothetical protein